ncbi:MAG: RNA polymerase sigma factor [Pseudomonadota bacterium]
MPEDLSPDYTEGPEPLVVALARTGDRDAFAELVRRRERWLRLLLWRCCSDRALADDLAQQAFLQAWEKLRQLRDPARFGPWLKRLAINGWLARLRSSDALAAPVEAFDELTDAPAMGRPSTTTLALDLDAALTTLAPAARTCVVLAYHEGLTHDEIAAMTTLPLGTVKSHVRRGTQRLKQLLNAYEDPSVHSQEAVR